MDGHGFYSHGPMDDHSHGPPGGGSLSPSTEAATRPNFGGWRWHPEKRLSERTPKEAQTHGDL